MRRFRTHVTLFCGLAFLAQAFVVSAAEIAPGHGSAPCKAHVTASQKLRNCCDGANCTDMVGCPLAQPALIAAPQFTVDLPTVAFSPATIAAAVADPYLTSPLRPPITLHG